MLRLVLSKTRLSLAMFLAIWLIPVPAANG
jgi:hypothetical protein